MPVQLAGGTAGTAAGSGDTSGTGGASAPTGVTLVDCKAEDGTTDPCGTYTTAVGSTTPGMKIQLGPLGGQMEKNVGKGFENTISASDADRTPASCQSFVDLFMQDPQTSKLLLDTKDLDFALFSVYHPANWEAGKTYPIITWGNGTCAMPEGYGALLRLIASYGYVIFAANSRQVSDLSITPKPMVRALDFAFAANEDQTSPYYHKLDTTQVAALGHSQGGAATIATADDKRVTAAIIYNGGKSASKPFLTISADRDIPGIGASSGADLKPGRGRSAQSRVHFLSHGSDDRAVRRTLDPDAATRARGRSFDQVPRPRAQARSGGQGLVRRCELQALQHGNEFRVRRTRARLMPQRRRPVAPARTGLPAVSTPREDTT